ncbi:hypothetical protein [Actinomadura sp. CNU-125]|uniref:hypothetical protein n=1 Tax=Actinomadura sp. CNU-125 TaxID=1904961 RepID=UPI000B19F56B|nr:hypothetical protein [Actinomadura sp. CNU-125]
MTDENTLITPDSWRRARHPRRDRPDVPAAPKPIEGAAERVRSLVADVRDDIERILDLPDTPPDIADAARAHLRGEPDPLGAAAVLLVAAPLNRLHRWSDPLPDRLFTDALVADHGLAFAARAVTEWAAVRTDVPPPHEKDKPITVRHRGPAEQGTDWELSRAGLRSLRARLAAAPDDVYAETVEALAGARRNMLQRLVAAYLAPTREDWVEDLFTRPEEAPGNYQAGWMALCALGRPGQLARFGSHRGHRLDREVLATLIDGVGPEPVVPLLAAAKWGYTETVRLVVEFLAVLPVEEAFQTLVDGIDEPEVFPGLVAAARRFPVRAMRLLPGSDAPRAAELLSVHVRANPGIAEEVAGNLPDGDARAKIREILAANTRVPSAPAADLPPLLTEPPWTRARAKVKPVVVKDLPAPSTRAVAWGPGERDAWTARLSAHWDARAATMDFAALAANIAAGGREMPVFRNTLFLKGPEELVRPLLKGWEPGDSYRDLHEVHEWLPALVARHGVDAHDPALSLARRKPAALGQYLLPLLSDEIARTMAEWLVRLKSGGRTARAWFRRHGTAAAPALIPDALGKAGPARRAAEAALRLIADRDGRDGRDAIVEAARVHGDKAAAGIGALLSADPLDDLPKNIPSVDWADPRTLPQILLRGRTNALPDDAAGHVLTMLAMSVPGNEYAGVRIVRDLCDPASLAEFGWALFRWWETCGAPPKENWGLTQLALTGDDDTVRRLTPVIRAWPGDGGQAKAVTGLEVLAAIGTETALMHLHSIAQRVKSKALQTRAGEKIQEVAAELELTTDQLADRVVPDFGLDASGTLTLDYGTRRFVVGFDEVLRPTITTRTASRASRSRSRGRRTVPSWPPPPTSGSRA